MDVNETLYSDQRLERFLAGKRVSSPRRMISELVDDVKHFTEGAAQSDDITALALLYFGTPQPQGRIADHAQP
jgi:serine phosphatase RsbU (regulator of sigma subunit)